MTEEQIIKVRMVYLGIDRDAKGKRVQCWFLLKEGELKDMPPLPENAWNRKETLVFSKLGRKAGNPGAVWEHDKTSDTTFSVLGTYVGFWPHSDQVMQWQLRHRALENKLRQEAKKTAEMRQNAVFEALGPIQDLYGKVTPALRPHLLAYVIEFITRRKR